MGSPVVYQKYGPSNSDRAAPHRPRRSPTKVNGMLEGAARRTINHSPTRAHGSARRRVARTNLMKFPQPVGLKVHDARMNCYLARRRWRSPCRPSRRSDRTMCVRLIAEKTARAGERAWVGVRLVHSPLAYVLVNPGIGLRPNWVAAAGERQGQTTSRADATASAVCSTSATAVRSSCRFRSRRPRMQNPERPRRCRSKYAGSSAAKNACPERRR